MLIIVFGLPGTGKTFFATALAKALGCRHLNTDIVRKELAGKVDYSFEGRMEVYDQMLSLSEEVIKKGEDLIVDGTFLKNELREKFEKMAAQWNIETWFIETKADEEEIKERVSKKREYSDADFQVYQKLKEEFEFMDKKQLSLWSDKMELQEMIYEAKKFLRRL